MKIGETINNIIGCTLNPVNQQLSCGGSSGGEYRPRPLVLFTDLVTGEGALLALKGSCLGVGSDIGQCDELLQSRFPCH